MEFKKYIEVLKASQREPGSQKEISKEAGVSEEETRSILEELKEFSLVYTEDSFWALTEKGEKMLSITE